MEWGTVKALRLMKGDSGAAAIEFAFVFPLLIYFTLTLIYLGLYMSVAHSVQQLAADGARASVAGLGDAEREQLTIAHVNASAPHYFAIENDRLNVAFQPEAGNAVRVTLSYDASNVLGWYPESLVPVLSSTITRAAVVRNGGF